MAYVEAPVKGFVDIYNHMIQLGGYQPSLSLQISLFKALLRGTGGTVKHHLRPAEAVFQNLKTAGHRIKEDIYEKVVGMMVKRGGDEVGGQGFQSCRPQHLENC